MCLLNFHVLCTWLVDQVLQSLRVTCWSLYIYEHVHESISIILTYHNIKSHAQSLNLLPHVSYPCRITEQFLTFSSDLSQNKVKTGLLHGYKGKPVYLNRYWSIASSPRQPQYCFFGGYTNICTIFVTLSNTQ